MSLKIRIFFIQVLNYPLKVGIIKRSGQAIKRQRNLSELIKVSCSRSETLQKIAATKWRKIECRKVFRYGH